MRKLIGVLLIVMSFFVFVGTVLIASFVGHGFREKILNAFQEGLTDGASLVKECSPCCDLLTTRTLPEMDKTIGELQGALQSLGPIAAFTVDAADFKVVFIQPFGQYAQAGADFRAAVPVMQRSAAQARMEIQQIQQTIPKDMGARMASIGILLSLCADLAEQSIRLHYLLVPVVGALGAMLALLTFLNGYFLCKGFPGEEKKEKRR